MALEGKIHNGLVTAAVAATQIMRVRPIQFMAPAETAATAEAAAVAAAPLSSKTKNTETRLAGADMLAVTAASEALGALDIRAA